MAEVKEEGFQPGLKPLAGSWRRSKMLRDHWATEVDRNQGGFVVAHVDDKACHSTDRKSAEQVNGHE